MRFFDYIERFLYLCRHESEAIHSIVGFCLYGSLFYGVLTPNGIDAVAEAGIEVRPYMFYPNPAQDQLRLQYSPDVQPKQIELYDQQGRLVRLQGNAFETFDLGSLPIGTYTLRVIMDDGQVFTDKVVKE